MGAGFGPATIDPYEEDPKWPAQMSVALLRHLDLRRTYVCRGYLAKLIS